MDISVYNNSPTLYSQITGNTEGIQSSVFPISTPVESNNKKYLLAKESCQTRIDLRGGSLFAEFVGPENDCFMGIISLKDLVFIHLLNTLNILLHIYDRKLCVHGPVHGHFDASRYHLPSQFKRQWTLPFDR